MIEKCSSKRILLSSPWQSSDQFLIFGMLQCESETQLYDWLIELRVIFGPFCESFKNIKRKIDVKYRISVAIWKAFCQSRIVLLYKLSHGSSSKKNIMLATEADDNTSLLASLVAYTQLLYMYIYSMLLYSVFVPLFCLCFTYMQ